MKIINQITVDTDTYSFLEMEELDYQAITEHIGAVNGKFICYNGLSTVNEKILEHPHIAMFWADIISDMTFATLREAELWAQSHIYQTAYARINYSVSMIMQTISTIKKVEPSVHTIGNRNLTDVPVSPFYRIDNPNFIKVVCIKSRNKINESERVRYGDTVGDIIIIDRSTLYIDKEGTPYAYGRPENNHDGPMYQFRLDRFASVF